MFLPSGLLDMFSDSQQKQFVLDFVLFIDGSSRQRQGHHSSAASLRLWAGTSSFGFVFCIITTGPKSCKSVQVKQQILWGSCDSAAFTGI